MSDTTKKFSLLNKINNIKDNNNYNDKDNVYHFNNIYKIIINDVCISVSANSILKVKLRNGIIEFNIINEKELGTFQIEYDKLQDLYLLIRNE